MVELRKRKTPPPTHLPPKKKVTKEKAKPTDAPAAKTKAQAPSKAKTEAAPAAASPDTAEAPPSSTGGVSKGSTISALDKFGGTVETNDGESTTLAKLLEKSENGVVLFTYPKASTPGCTTQACFFRDSYSTLTSTGLSIYGLSTDSPKSNSSFKNRQNLPYTLLCDPKQTLIKAIGMSKAGEKTWRGVFVVDKHGKVLAAQTGGPANTMDVVMKLVEETKGE